MVALEKKRYVIDRLVGLAFIPNPKNKPFVDHVNNNPLYNNISNLIENQRNSKLSKRYGDKTRLIL